MPKRPETYFEHIFTAITEIESFIAGYSFAQFQRDNKTVSAVIRQLEIIGEAAGRVPKEMVADAPLPWDKLVGMRNKLIHDYFGVDVGIVWKTVTEALPPLKTYIQGKIRG